MLRHIFILSAVLLLSGLSSLSAQQITNSNSGFDKSKARKVEKAEHSNAGHAGHDHTPRFEYSIHPETGAAVPQLLPGVWTYHASSTSSEGERITGEVLYSFSELGTVTAKSMENKGRATWTFDPAHSRLTITDKTAGETISYTIVEMSSQDMIWEFVASNKEVITMHLRR